MLQDGFAHAGEDRDARALAEQRVEAVALLDSLAAALVKDADLLSAGERANVDALRARLQAVRSESDHRAIKAAIAGLNDASADFAARRMDRAIGGALAGRKIDDVARGGSEP